MKNVSLIILVTIITLTEALGQFLLSVYHHKKNKNTYYGPLPIKILPIITWLLYGICTYLLLHSYKYTTMGNAEVYWDAMSALIVPIIGVVYFGNKINLVGWGGIGLIITGTFMLSLQKIIAKDI